MIAGCGGDSLSGKYELKEYSVAGMDLISLLGLDGDDAGTYLEFLSGGKMNAVFFGETDSGTFKVSGSKVTMTVDGDDMTGTISGKKITIEIEEDGETAKMVFEKK